MVAVDLAYFFEYKIVQKRYFIKHFEKRNKVVYLVKQFD